MQRNKKADNGIIDISIRIGILWDFFYWKKTKVTVL